MKSVFIPKLLNNPLASCSLIHFDFLLLHTIHFDVYFLIPAVIIQVINPISELIIPIKIPTKEAKTEMKMHPVIVEITISE